MKSEDWKKVKVGTQLILADVNRGVFRARVSEIDVEIAVDHPTYHKAQPYGLTADKGTVKIIIGETEELANLRDLIKYTTALFNTLMTAYNRYVSYHAAATGHKATFQTLVNTEKAK